MRMRRACVALGTLALAGALALIGPALAQAPAQGAGGGARAQAPAEPGALEALLAVPGPGLRLVVGDLARSLAFYRDGVGLAELDQTTLADGTTLVRLRFGTGSIVELYAPASPPEDGHLVEGVAVLRDQIIAADGIKLLFLRHKDTAGAAERLAKLGFGTPEAGTTRGVGGYSLIADPDGVMVGLQPIPPQALARYPEALQAALTVRDAEASRAFYGKLGLNEVGQIPIASIKATEFRYGVGQGLVKFWAPPGERPSHAGADFARRGARSLVFHVGSLEAAASLLEARGVAFERSMSPSGKASLTAKDPDDIPLHIVTD